MPIVHGKISNISSDQHGDQHKDMHFGPLQDCSNATEQTLYSIATMKLSNGYTWYINTGSTLTHCGLGPVSIRKTVFPGMGIPMLKIRRPVGRLIFNMGIAIPSKTVFLIETAPWWRHMTTDNWVNIGPSSGSFPGGTKPLPESMLISVWSFGINLKAVSSGMLKIFVSLICVGNL